MSLPYTSWPRDMNPALCLTCEHATLTPAGIHICLVNAQSMSWGSEPMCAKYAKGNPKLLTYQELLEYNSTSKVKPKKRKENGKLDMYSRSED